MKTKAQELRQLTSDALRVKADELRVTIQQMRFGAYQGKEKNVKMLSVVRHELSRVLTILTEHEKKSHSSTK
jgi:ribosomal protein L29